MQNNIQSFPYTIKHGDTLYLIAKRFNTTAEAIVRINPGINSYNLTIGQVISIPSSDMKLNVKINQNVLNLNNQMRILWEQHIVWTRLVIQDIIYDLPELEFSVARLLRNPDDFAIQLAPFYGHENAQVFATLLRDHLTLAADLVKAAKAGDQEKVSNINKEWFQNADDIANFLAQVNPHWTFKEWQEMLYNHLNLVKTEALNFLHKNLKKNVDLLDEMERQALEMADALTTGIVQQFPDRFYKPSNNRYYYL